MNTLIIGFDSAWTPTNAGAIAGALIQDNGSVEELGDPLIVNYPDAERAILDWQITHPPTSTLVLLDQPTIVANATGQRPVEHIVSSAVSRRYGGMQPANTSRTEMFGADAPVWPFLNRFGGAADPLAAIEGVRVYETYPVLAMIALGWLLPDKRPTGRLPKYNPGRRRTFSIADWRYVCSRLRDELASFGLTALSAWIDRASQSPSPRKHDQDCVDACICLLVALHLAAGKACMMVGDVQTGYIVAPESEELRGELIARCEETGRESEEWIREVRRNAA